MAKTIKEARRILTVENRVKLLTEGSKRQGTPVITLRANNYGHYIPCVSFISHVTPSGRIAVDLYEDRSERVIVSAQAVLWEPAALTSVS